MGYVVNWTALFGRRCEPNTKHEAKNSTESNWLGYRLSQINHSF